MPIAEISVFGGKNSYGESIVIHDGSDNWFVIDSFIDKKSKESVPLTYLKDQKVDLSKIKRIIATHWDNDHINGLEQLVQACPSAEFICTAAYRNAEFLTLLHADSKTLLAGRSLTIFRKILAILESRNKVPIDAVQDLTVWKDSVSASELISLSPSPKTVNCARQELKKIIDSDLSIGKKIPNLDSNDRSVVVNLKLSDVNILLGADLEVSSDSARGWGAVYSAVLCPSEIQLMKVPHHGSSNGFFEPLWKARITDKTLSCTVPFGQFSLPEKKDVNRILSYMPKASYITSDSKLSKRIKFDHSTDKLLDRIGKTVMELDNYEFGQVKFSYDLTVKPVSCNVALIGSARKLLAS